MNDSINNLCETKLTEPTTELDPKLIFEGRNKPSLKLGPELNGLLLVDKPKSMTSHSLVAIIRRLAGQKGCGHTGTLDPMATGLMLILLGFGTKLANFMVEADKSYLAVIHLGLVTDTLDVTGQTIAEWSKPFPDLAMIQEVLKELEGPSQQVPPAFSAIKVAGKPAYKAARKGKMLDLPPRPVTAYSLSVVDYRPPFLSLKAFVSKGYYIRSLARDVGLKLGLGGGSLADLRRLSVGSFTLEQAGAIPDDREELIARLLSPRQALYHLPELVLPDPEVKALSQGQRLFLPTIKTAEFRPAYSRSAMTGSADKNTAELSATDGTYKIINSSGLLVALGQVTSDGPEQGQKSTQEGNLALPEQSPQGPFLRPLRVFTLA
ncbi:MAG: tRNA pseudouridine(55) synthase TruB [Deltaproteobacteria bacterium]|nr:tRNA pseudouridine(55) synthase TruB [Deltaproteobacteria bacterium]